MFSEGSIAACNSTTEETGKVDGRCHNLDQAVARGVSFEERNTGSQVGEGNSRPQT